MRWFRFYDEALDDPKVQRLSHESFHVWVNLLCVASRNNGHIPADLTDLAFSMRMQPARLDGQIKLLIKAGLLDHDDTLRPHNWDGRQYHSDSSTERTRRHRQRHRDADGTSQGTSHVTNSDAPDTEQNRTEQKERGADAPHDVLWKDGVSYLRDRGGKTESNARSLIGKWVKSSTAEAVIDLIARAQAEKVIEPVAFIEACLKRKIPKSGADPGGYRPMASGAGG